MSALQKNLVAATPPESTVVGGLVEAALEIALRRSKILGDLKQALESNQKERALKLARKLCGLTDEH